MKYEYKKREDLVFKMCKLGLWYLHYHTSRGESFHEILNQQLPLYRLTTLYNGSSHPANSDFPWQDSQWGRLVDILLTLYKENESDCTAFEEKGLDLLYSYIKDRIETDIENWPWIPCGYSAYKLPEEQVFDIFAYEKSPSQDVVHFHIANSCMPESPFRDMNARACGLLDMIRAIKNRLPYAEKIKCNSWINSFPPFLKLFPASYPQENIVPQQVGYNFGYWGQFVMRDGSFHDKHGKIMRDTGKFPFTPRVGICQINELEKHLELSKDILS